MRRFARFVGIPLCLFSAALNAEIHRCKGEHGEPLYTQRACHSTSTAVAAKGSRAVAADSGLRAAEKAWLESRPRTVPGRRTRRAASASTNKADKAAQRAYQCRNKRRLLDGLNARLRAGYRAGAGERLHRRRAAYEDYLASFCS